MDMIFHSVVNQVLQKGVKGQMASKANSTLIATLALGSRPKRRVASQEGDLGVTSHAPGSAKSVRE
jgi:hypothetical protein